MRRTWNFGTISIRDMAGRNGCDFVLAMEVAGIELLDQHRGFLEISEVHNFKVVLQHIVKFSTSINTNISLMQSIARSFFFFKSRYYRLSVVALRAFHFTTGTVRCC